jgi:hypothetical protein
MTIARWAALLLALGFYPSLDAAPASRPNILLYAWQRSINDVVVTPARER